MYFVDRGDSVGGVAGAVPGGAGYRPPGVAVAGEDPPSLCISRSQTHAHPGGGLHGPDHRRDSEVSRNM